MKCSNFYRMSPTMGGHLFWYPFCYPKIEQCIECDFESVLPFIHISRICHRTWHANLKIDGKNDIFDLLVRFVFVIMQYIPMKWMKKISSYLYFLIFRKMYRYIYWYNNYIIMSFPLFIWRNWLYQNRNVSSFFML